MGQECSVVAVDIGSTIGKAALVNYVDGTLHIEEPQQINIYTVEAYHRLYWNALRTYSELEASVQTILDTTEVVPSAIAISGHMGDSLALIDTKGHVLGLPVCYDPDRLSSPVLIEHRTPSNYQHRLAGLRSKLPELYSQLVEMSLINDPRLEVAETMISLPDLYLYWISGNAISEVTGASSTFLYDLATNEWAHELLERQGIPQRLLPSILNPGTLLGRFRGMKVLTTASSSVAASAAAIPAETSDYAFFISGSYTYAGTHLTETLATKARLNAGFDHQVSAFGQYLLSKQLDGLQLIDNLMYAGGIVSQDTAFNNLLEQAAAAAPLQRLVPTSAYSIKGEAGINAVNAAFSTVGQSTPVTDGEVVRALLESLALDYANAVEALEKVTKSSKDVIHIVGEAAGIDLLCQAIADASERPVIAGPIDAALLGNAIVQLEALKESGECPEYSREEVLGSMMTKRFDPMDADLWQDARAGRFKFLA